MWVASPRPVTELAAAYLADADGLMAIGGAQAIGALAYGVPEHNIPCSDVIVGPGNKWAAAKSLVSGKVQIDMLAGPSGVGDCHRGDPATVASDLLAQAEHDIDASYSSVHFPKSGYGCKCRVSEAISGAAHPRKWRRGREEGLRMRMS